MKPSVKKTKAPPGPMRRGFTFRQGPQPADLTRVRELVSSTGFFSPMEMDIAVELVAEGLARGEESGYIFLFAEQGDRVLGYTCYGPIAGTFSSYDLYWIVVEAGRQGKGLGKALLTFTERDIFKRGGRRIYADTSSRSQYEPTRRFYKSCGYHEEARLEDFYAPGDGKVIYVKILT